jgi:PhoPQ-activated pathogenicity-related protein
VPNSGHGLEDRFRVVATVGAFARSIAGQFKMPRLEAKMTDEKAENRVAFNLDGSKGTPISVSIWQAESESKDFRRSKWKETKKAKSDILDVHYNSSLWNAFFVEAKFSINGKTFTLSTPIQVVER